MLLISLLWGLAIIAFAVSVFCSLAEGAIFYHSPSRVEASADTRERLVPYVPELDRYLFSARILMIASDVILVALVAATVFRRAAGDASLLPLFATVAAAMACVVLFTEVIPRALAEAYADRLLARVLPGIAILDRAFLPLLWPLHRVKEALLNATGPEPRERAADDILSATLEAEREGVLKKEDASMIESIIEFREAEVRDIMTPRTDMVCLEIGASLQEVSEAVVAKGHSRIPVFEGTRDHIVGLVYAKDLLRHISAEGENPNGVATLKKLLRKPFFVPATKPIGELLKEFRAKKVHIAVVLDEYGGTAGVVTIEDILEEIVGEIEDEYDEGERPPVERIDPMTADVDAKLHVDELNKELGLELPDNGEYETLGGFVMHSLGRVPCMGEAFSRDNVRFIVLHADERRVNRVRIERAAVGT